MRERKLSKYEREKKIEELSKMKISLYDQRDVASKVVAFLGKLSLTQDGEKMRKGLAKVCKLRIARINKKINETNDEIYLINTEGEGVFD